MQKELAGRENEKCESGSVCVSAPPEPINSQYVCVCLCFPHENTVRPAPPEYKTPIYPIAQLGALKFAPTSNVLRPRQPQQNVQARAARGAERETERCSWLLYRLKQHERQRRQHNCVRGVNMTFLAARSAGCPRITDTGHRIVQRRGRRIERRGTENRRGEGG